MILLPIPREINYDNEKYTLPEKISVLCESEKVKNYIKGFLKEYELSETKADIEFKISADLKDEEYTLEISGVGIYICGGSEKALFYAAATLKQIILQAEDSQVQFMKIKDYPDIEKRGIMLDVSRGRIPKPETVMKVVDILADLKYNELQLYFDNIVFEYKSMAAYYEKGKVLSIEDIEKIKEYCHERFIELVPNQNSLGHMHGWIELDEFKELGIKRDDNGPTATINPLDPNSFALVDRLYNDLLPNFSADRVHVGMDEPFELGHGQTKEACEKEGRGKVYTDYLKKICNLASEKYGKRPMFWDDIIIKYPEFIDELPKDCIVVDWGYEAETKYEKRGMRLKASGLDYYVAPGTSNWGAVTGRGHNMLYNIQIAAVSATTWGAKGFLLTDWCDEGGVMPIFMSYLAYIIGAAYSWNSGCSGEEFENNEDEYEQNLYRVEVLDKARDYLDKFIFMCEGKSFAHVLWRLNKACLLEPDIVYNQTQLSRLARLEVPVEELRGVHPEYFEEIEEFVKRRQQEAKKCVLKCEDADLIKTEFELLCDIAVFVSNAVQICAGEYNNMPYDVKLGELEPIKERFETLWRVRNLDGGYRRYESRLEGVCKKVNDFIEKRECR